ncbi:hypothetical protein PPROV_000151200 [Pycnococcus provasolii]|uniref:Uncharacterized protein n=1 Tax=Pycnococcus provasolii TaxID=41880 RepID=A0A830HCD6_9CHLO|nr:hypothetical protein PPROV_000151200 [Pycnococcus provasolii]
MSLAAARLCRLAPLGRAAPRSLVVAPSSPSSGRFLVNVENMACKRNLKKEKRTRNRINSMKYKKKPPPRFARRNNDVTEAKNDDWESPFLTDENGNFLPVKEQRKWTLDPSTNTWTIAATGSEETEGIEVVMKDD